MGQTPTETIKNYYKPLIRFIEESIKNDNGELPNFKSDLQEILDQFNPTNFAIYSITSDIMYTIRQALMADKKITAKEIKVVGPLVKSILKKFSELRKDYRSMIDVPDEKLWDSIQYWHKDKKPFGWGFAGTQIVGLELIAFYSITQNNPTVFLDYKNMLSALYQSVLEADGMSDEEIVKLKEFNSKLNEISKIDFLKYQYDSIEQSTNNSQDQIPDPKDTNTTKNSNEQVNNINSKKGLSNYDKIIPLAISSSLCGILVAITSKYLELNLCQFFISWFICLFWIYGYIYDSRKLSLKIWNSRTGELITELKGHNDYVNSIACSSDGNFLISGGKDNTVIIWDLNKKIKLRKFYGFGKGVKSICISNNGMLIAGIGFDKTLKVWDFVTGEVLFVLEKAICAAFSPDSKSIAINTKNKSIPISIFNTVNFKNDIEIKGDHSWMSYELKNINYSPDGTLICGSNYESINIWNVRDGNLFKNLKGHKGQVNFCTFSPDGKMIASAGKDKTVKIWNLKETKEKFDYKTHTASINSVAFNKNSNSVLSASNDCTTKMFDIDTGNPSLILEKHNDFVRQAVFGFNDDLIITTGD